MEAKEARELLLGEFTENVRKVAEDEDANCEANLDSLITYLQVLKRCTFGWPTPARLPYVPAKEHLSFIVDMFEIARMADGPISTDVADLLYEDLKELEILFLNALPRDKFDS